MNTTPRWGAWPRRGRLSTLTLLVAASSAAAQAQPVACGVQRWSVKVLLDDDTARVDFTPRRTTVGILGELPRPEGPIPGHGRAAPYELQTFTVRARIRAIRVEGDADWHLILEDTAAAGVTMIAEVPDSACALGTRWAAVYAEVRRTLRRLPKYGLVDVTGVGFFDYAHQQRGAAPNIFELHPVIKVTPVLSSP